MPAAGFAGAGVAGRVRSGAHLAAALVRASILLVMVFSLVRGYRTPVTKKTDCRSNSCRPTTGLSIRPVRDDFAGSAVGQVRYPAPEPQAGRRRQRHVRTVAITRSAINVISC